MPRIHVERRHGLAPEAARQRVETLARDLASRLGAEYRWQGNRLCFSRPGASGTIALLPDRIELDLKLGLVLAPMKGRIEQTVREYLDQHVA